ncbi:flagellar biosynthesis protein FlgM [Amedibacterium intestinale]|uniref:flagellar biosynthesis protein FlgM n=1 Tax=Amedibacterium intestinale TaxID=2583452 RepID=UPI000E1FCB19
MKKLISMIAVAALLMTGCAKELKVTPAENLKVEYGEKLDNTKLFNVKESDENVKVDKVEGFDAKKLGEQEITVTFTDGEREKEGKVIITVEDTKKPAIEFKKESVSITAGDKLVLKDNIKSVKDPVDGDLKYSEKAVEKDGYYIDKGKLDTKKAGTYDVKVIAADKNGNKTEKSFKVIVKKKETAKKPSTNNSGNGYSANTPTNNSGFSSSKPNNSENSSSSNGGSSSNSGNSNGGSSNNGGGQKPVNPAPHQHSITVTGHPDVVYSNMWFESIEESAIWADSYRGPNGDWSGFGYSSAQCSCGMWSPYFFNVTTWE